jgi:hypothetical protein
MPAWFLTLLNQFKRDASDVDDPCVDDAWSNDSLIMATITDSGEDGREMSGDRRLRTGVGWVAEGCWDGGEVEASKRGEKETGLSSENRGARERGGGGDPAPPPFVAVRAAALPSERERGRERAV